MPEKIVDCFYHSGHEARIAQAEKNDEDIFGRLRLLEMAVWKAAGTTGVITAFLTTLAIVVIEKVIK